MLTQSSVKPHGKLPWFFTTTHALADKIRARRGDSRSVRTGETGWEYEDRLGSKASNQPPELVTVTEHPLPTDPQLEKVLRKM